MLMQRFFIFTAKDLMIYCLFTAWEDHETINLLHDIKAPQVAMLGYEGAVQWHVDGDTLTIDLPELAIAGIPCLHAWSFKIALEGN